MPEPKSVAISRAPVRPDSINAAIKKADLEVEGVLKLLANTDPENFNKILREFGERILSLQLQIAKAHTNLEESQTALEMLNHNLQEKVNSANAETLIHIEDAKREEISARLSMVLNEFRLKEKMCAAIIKRQTDLELDRLSSEEIANRVLRTAIEMCPFGNIKALRSIYQVRDGILIARRHCSIAAAINSELSRTDFSEELRLCGCPNPYLVKKDLKNISVISVINGHTDSEPKNSCKYASGGFFEEEVARK